MLRFRWSESLLWYRCEDHATKVPRRFFMRITNQIRERLVWYRATIEVGGNTTDRIPYWSYLYSKSNENCHLWRIKRTQLRKVVKLSWLFPSMVFSPHSRNIGITTTVQAQHATFLALASKTAALDTELQKIKALYTHLWRTRTGSVRDPFDGVGVDDSQGKSDLGLSGLSVR